MCGASGAVCRFTCDSHRSLNEQFLDRRDCPSGIQSLWAGARAVENRVATVELEWIFKLIQSLTRRLIATVAEPSIRLEEDGGAEKPICVPPVTWATCRTAKAEDALVGPVKAAAVFDRLEPFFFGSCALRLDPGFDGGILGKKVAQIHNEILENAQVIQRVDGGRLRRFGNQSGTGEPVRSVDVHGAGAADAFAARAAECESGTDLVLDLDQRVENHRPALIEIDLKPVQTRIPARVRVVPVYFEGFHAPGPRRGRPGPPGFNPGLRGYAQISGKRESLQHRDAGLLIRSTDNHGDSSHAATAAFLIPADD